MKGEAGLVLCMYCARRDQKLPCCFASSFKCPALLRNTMRLPYKHFMCRTGSTWIWTWIVQRSAWKHNHCCLSKITSQTLSKTIDLATGPTTLIDAKWPDLDFGLKKVQWELFKMDRRQFGEQITKRPAVLWGCTLRQHGHSAQSCLCCYCASEVFSKHFLTSWITDCRVLRK